MVMFATVRVVEVVSPRYCVTVTVTFPDVLTIAAFALSVEDWVTLLATVCADSVEFAVEVTLLLVLVVFWGWDDGDVETIVELLP